MSLPNHVKFRVDLTEILANLVLLHIRIRECKADQQAHKPIAEYPIPDGLTIDYAEKQQRLENEFKSILDDMVCKYPEISLPTLECFYSLGDAEDVANYGQELIDWIADIRKHLIHLKGETTKMLRDKAKDPEISKDSSFPSYEQRLKDIYHSVVKFEHWLKIKPKVAAHQVLAPPPLRSQVLPYTNNGVALTERLDRIRSTFTTFQTSRPEFSTSLFEIHQKYHLELSQPSPSSSQISDAIYHAVGAITSESLSLLLSTAKAGCQEALTHNEETSHAYLGQQLQASFGLIHIVLGYTNAAMYSLPEEGEIFE